MEANPLWSVPLSALTATRERPVFSPSRRAPQLPAEPEPVADAAPPPPPPPEPETPSLTLVGTVINEPESIAIIHDDKTNTTVRVHTGESVSGWVLVSVEPGTMTLEKNSQTATVTMPPPGAVPPQGPMVSQADQSSGAF
jgi:general secretion pathway protein N